MNGDTGYFSVRRPRETLGNMNLNSAIPQPASALKRSNSISNIKENAPATSGHARSISSSRMSLAPSRPPQPSFQRSSSGTNLVELGRPSTVQRSSSNIFNNASASRMSLAPNVLMTPHGKLNQSLGTSQSIQRRSSVYSRHSSSGPASNQSFFVQAPIPAGVPRDPRPLKDRTYQAKIGQEMLDYLTHNNFELEMKHSLGQNTLKSPTQKDFNFIFQWLYHRLDPSYKFQKNIDAEVPPILKQLRYPYEKSITKSQLVAVGGQNWSVFLGMLHWMMQLAQMLDRYDAGEYDEACAEAGIDVSGDRIIFRFLSGAYRDWLQVDEAADDEEDADRLLVPHVEAMAAEFQKGNEKYEQEMKILQAEHEALEQQIAEAEKDAPDLAKLDKDRQVLESDKKKFEDWNSMIERKIEKYETAVKALMEGLSQTEAEISAVENEKVSLQTAVDKQGITVEDIDRMSTERERLQKGVETTSTRLEEVKRKSSDKEAEASHALEDLERTIHGYNSLCYQNSLIPSSALNADGENFECHLLSGVSSSTHSSEARLLADPSTGYHPAHVLNLDLRSNIKSRLIRFRKEISERRTLASEKNNEDHELLDSIKDAIDDKKIEVEALEHKVRAAAEEHDKMRDEVTTQKVASDAQIERMEKELAKMRGNLQGDVQLIEQREMNTNIELEQLALRASALREELHTGVERMLNNIIAFKVHIQKSLEDYENFVMEEVEQELGSEGESLMAPVVEDEKVVDKH